MRNERVAEHSANIAEWSSASQLLAEEYGHLKPRTEREIERRETRHAILGSKFAHGPGWDMLLELMDAELEGRTLSVKALCIAGRCPKTSAIRAIGKIEEAGLVERVPDREDGRRCFVSLTPKGKSLLLAYFESIA